MSVEKVKKPLVRFKGFNEEWEERKLGDLAEIVRGASPRPIQDPKWFDKNSEVGWLRISDVTEQNGRIYRLEQCLSKLGQEKTRVLMKPHLLLSIAATVGKPVVNYVKTGVHDGFLIFMQPRFNREFMFQWLEQFRPMWQQYGQPGSQVNLNSELVKNQDILLPASQEQQKIGLLFQHLDNIITQKQKKLELLKQLKQTLFIKLFPTNNNKIPLIRFKEFSDEWEECKFINLLDKKNGLRRGPFGSSLRKDFFVAKSNYVVYEQQNAIYDYFNTRYNITKEKFEELHQFKLEPGDFIMSGAGTIGRISRVPFGIKQGIFNQALIRFKINKEITDSDYFLQWIRSDNIQRQFTGATSGSAMSNLVPMSEVKKWVILIPLKLEQQKIGLFFKTLDNIITLQQREVELLKTIKKSLLKVMFV